MFKRKGGGGVKGFLNNVKKTALFLHGIFPYATNKSINNQKRIAMTAIQWMPRTVQG